MANVRRAEVDVLPTERYAAVMSDKEPVPVERMDEDCPVRSNYIDALVRKYRKDVSDEV